MVFFGENERGAKIGNRKMNERSEAWEKYCEKLDRRRATAYIPAINAMSGLFVSAKRGKSLKAVLCFHDGRRILNN